MQDEAGYMVFLCQEARRTRANTSSKQDNSISWYVQVLSQIEIYCFDVVVETLLLRYVAVGFSEPGVLIDYRIDIHHF
jgi:hypothetical protein